MNVHQNTLIRITGIPYDILDQESTLLPNRVKDIVTFEYSKKVVIEKILNDLHIFNQTVDHKPLQSEIQNFRRVLFNNKPIKKDISFLSDIPELIRHDILELLQINNAIAELEVAFESEFAGIVLENRNLIKKAAANDLFLNGLYMASQSIFTATLKYITSDQDTFNKKQLNAERSILKYLSRTAAKTSPFSTLTSLSIGKMNDRLTDHYLAVESLKGLNTISFFRVNNSIQKTFKKLLSTDLDILKHFYVVPNSTIEIKNGLLTFLVNRNNIDAFQEIEINPVIDIILSYFSKKKSIRFLSLIEKLAKKVDSGVGEIEQYLVTLINSGLLNIEFGISGIDANWLSSMVKVLKKVFKDDMPDKILKMIETLDFLIISCDTVGSMDFTERTKLLKDVEEKVLNVISSFNDHGTFSSQKSAGNLQTILKSERIFYEDSVKDINLILSESKMQSIGKLLYELNQNIDILDLNRVENIKMYEFYKSKYKTLIDVPLTDFYRDFYKEVKIKENMALIVSPNDQSNRSYFLREKQYLESLALWKRHVLVNINFPVNPEDAIHFNLKQLQNANDAISFKPDLKKKRSVAGFIQVPVHTLNENPENELVALNSLFSGYGKMFTRFLHLFPKRITEAIKKDIIKGQPEDSIFVELQDSSYHNANLHPNLLPYEISIPGGHTSLPAKYQVLISDILVSIDKKKKVLKLIHGPSGKVIYPFDLGFQSAAGRSKLYTLLNMFTYGNFNPPIIMVNLINNELFTRNKSKDVIILPRIIYENKICLHRKAWMIKTLTIPVRQATDSDSSYYLNILKWKLSLSLPDVVFVRIVIKAVQQNLQYPEMGGDDYKPQYMNFNSPLLITLFEKLLSKAGEYVQIDEMLPYQDSLLKIEESRHVAELYVQIDG